MQTTCFVWEIHYRVYSGLLCLELPLTAEHYFSFVFLANEQKSGQDSDHHWHGECGNGGHNGKEAVVARGTSFGDHLEVFPRDSA